MRLSMRSSLHLLILAAAFFATIAVYWPGLSGTYIFDDYPNIIDNHGVQPHDANPSSLVRAALSSPSSDFKRPLASLSFATNYLATGLDPYWMKLTNLVIHLLNGLLVFLLAGALLRFAPEDAQPGRSDSPISATSTSTIAALIAAGWMLLPINLTAVLYVVQRMESMANVFVLLGLIGYVAGRRHMLAPTAAASPSLANTGWTWFWFCAACVVVPTALGVLAKETAVMLPLYALAIEWALLGFRAAPASDAVTEEFPRTTRQHKDWRVIGLFLLVLALPLIVGLAWQLPSLLQPERWSTRDFTLDTRLLSEARIVVDYIVWTLLPTSHALSFYHDNFRISTGLLTPWTTLTSLGALVGLFALMLLQRSRRPLVALGISFFLGCQILTGTILPLELIYEHRNYFASFGLLLAIVPLLAAPKATPFALPRRVLLAGLMMSWMTLTAITAYAWGNPLRLAVDLASRAPQSPRAQYELGRTYIIYSHYVPTSPFTQLAYIPLEKSAALPGSSILPEQALIYMNSRMQLPLKDAWWNSMITKLKAHPPTVQDESSLGALTQCARDHNCGLPPGRMMAAFMAALSHPHPSGRLLSSYSDYAWNVLNDKALAERMAIDAVRAKPDEPVYHITLIRMLIAQGQYAEAHAQLRQLELMNIGGGLNADISALQGLLGKQ
jgi:protein O-mannosyl-transferase